MKIIFFGTPHFVTPVLESLIKNFTVIAVVTAPDRKAGRKQLLTSSPIKTYVKNELYKLGKNSSDIPIFAPENPSSLISHLSSLKPDLFVVAAFGYILQPEMLAIPPFGAINVHPSLLPKFRGPTPVPATLLSGDTTTGVSIIKMDAEMDHGPVLAKQTYAIHETDTTETLLAHLFNLSAQMLPDVITNYTNGKILPEVQDESKATYTKLITKTDGMISPDTPPQKETVEKMIRAYYPWPGVWTNIRIRHKELRIKFLPDKKVQIEGKAPVTIKDCMNGYPELKPFIEKLLM